MNTDAVVQSFTVEKSAHSSVKITGEVPFEFLKKERAASLKELGKDLELKGFRKGHIPENILVGHLGEMAILQEMAGRALSLLYPSVLKEHNIDAISRPRISLTKLAPENPLGFTIELSMMPVVTLPEYKAVAKGVNKEREAMMVTDADIEDAILRIQRQKLSYDRIQEKAQKRTAAEDARKGGLTIPTPETVEVTQTEEDFSKAPLPVLTDEYVKTLGAFESVSAFKKQITEHLEREKKEEATSKHRARLTDAIIKDTEIDLPEVLIESELSQIFAQMEDDLKRAGLTVEGYLEHVKKTHDDLKKEWTPSAEKRAKTQLILNEIAKQESMSPKEDAVMKQTNVLLGQYKDADPLRVRIYVESMLRNSAVMEFLEAQ